jgi:hypothetical protein
MGDILPACNALALSRFYRKSSGTGDIYKVLIYLWPFHLNTLCIQPCSIHISPCDPVFVIKGVIVNKKVPKMAEKIPHLFILGKAPRLMLFPGF